MREGGEPLGVGVAEEDRERIGTLLDRACEGEPSFFQFKVDGEGGPLFFDSCFIPLKDHEGGVAKLMGVSSDITERRRADNLQSDQRRVLELITQGRASQTQIFEAIIEIAEARLPNVRSSILLLDGRALRHAAAPSLPDAYNAVIDGLEIGPGVGSCGTAMYRKERVVVEDVSTDLLWAAEPSMPRPRTTTKSCSSRWAIKARENRRSARSPKPSRFCNGRLPCTRTSPAPTTSLAGCC